MDTIESLTPTVTTDLLDYAPASTTLSCTGGSPGAEAVSDTVTRTSDTR